MSKPLMMVLCGPYRVKTQETRNKKQDSLICYFYQEKQKREQEEEEREKMKFLVSNFTEDQLDRYAMFRRSSFPKVFSNKQIHQLQQKLLSCCIIF